MDARCRSLRRGMSDSESQMCERATIEMAALHSLRLKHSPFSEPKRRQLGVRVHMACQAGDAESPTYVAPVDPRSRVHGNVIVTLRLTLSASGGPSPPGATSTVACVPLGPRRSRQSCPIVLCEAMMSPSMMPARAHAPGPTFSNAMTSCPSPPSFSSGLRISAPILRSTDGSRTACVPISQKKVMKNQRTIPPAINITTAVGIHHHRARWNTFFSAMGFPRAHCFAWLTQCRAMADRSGGASPLDVGEKNRSSRCSTSFSSRWRCSVDRPTRASEAIC